MNTVDVIGKVVGEAAKKFPLTPLNYQYGTPAEVETLLKSWTGTNEYDAKRFPLVWLVVNFPEEFDGTANNYRQAIVTIIIANATQQEYSTEERYEKNFNPLLIPIYDEIIRQLPLTKQIASLQPGVLPKHRRIIEAYWGRDGVLGGQNKNIFSDRIDAILITNLTLNIKTKC